MSPAAPRHFDRLVLAIGLCQMAGWGTTYYLPGIFSQPLAEATGLPKPAIFAGVTIMVAIASLSGVKAGRIIDKRGAKSGLVGGAILMAIGLAILAGTQGPVSYFTAFLLFGIGMPFGLSSGAHSALVQLRGANARTGINYLMLFTAIAQAVYWPLSAWLEGLFGWRMVCLIFAGLNLASALVYVLMLSPGLPQPPDQASEGAPTDPLLPAEKRRDGAAFLVIALAASGFVSWGLELHLLDMLVAMGIGQTAALAIVTLRGPVSIAARSTELMARGRISSLDFAICAAAIMALSLVLAQFIEERWIATLFMLLFGIGTGVMTVARATLPLTLFGPAGYATLIGRIGLPTQFVYAISPPIFGWLNGSFGVSIALTVALLSMVVAVIALVRLKGLMRQD